jgi:hypothetical protein
MALRKKAPAQPIAPPTTPREQARGLLARYWGATGPDRVLNREALRELKLSRIDCEALLDELPPPGVGGDTGERVAECYRFLERLERA